MSRLHDDYDPRLVPKKDETQDDDGPPTRDLKPLSPRTEPRQARTPAAKIDLDSVEDNFGLSLPRAPSS